MTKRQAKTAVKKLDEADSLVEYVEKKASSDSLRVKARDVRQEIFDLAEWCEGLAEGK